jgi:hypothetical protein
VVAHRSVSTRELHVPDLTFAGVQKNTVCVPAVLIAILPPRVTCEEKDTEMISRGRDPALALTSEARVDLGAALVDLPYLEQTRSSLLRAYN